MMKRLFCTAVLLAAAVFSVNAQTPYAQLWTKVRKADKAGKPQTAAGYLRELEAMTVQAGDELEQLAVSEALLARLQDYNWKEANEYRPVCTALRNRVLRDSLDAYIAKYENHPRIVRLLWQRLQDRKQDLDRYRRTPAPTGEDYLDLREEALNLLKHKNAGDYRQQIRSFVDGMDRPSLSVSGTPENTVFCPGDEFACTFRTRNIRELEMKLYRLPDNTVFTGGHTADAEESLRRRATLVCSQTVRGFRNEYNIDEVLADSCKVRFPQAGVYVLRFRSDNGASYYRQLNVSDVVGAARKRNGKVEVLALDYRTGRPLDSATVRVYKNPLAHSQSALAGLSPWKSETIRFNGFRPSAAADKAAADRENVWLLRVDAEEDGYAPLMTLPGGWSRPVPMVERSAVGEEAQFFVLTDRALYKPTDTIRFKLICYETRETNGKVLPDRAVKLRIRPVSSDKSVAETLLVTNEFGSAAGSFVLPEGSPNGTWLIETESHRTLKYVRVEEYKRPEFSVFLQPSSEPYLFGDIVKQTGRLLSYAGFSVAGGEVRYTVTRSVHSGSHGYLPQESVLEGTTFSDRDGNFEIVFPALWPWDDAAEEADDETRVYYHISVQAADPQGETHEASAAVHVSNVPINLWINLPENSAYRDVPFVNKDRAKEMSIACTTWNGTPYATEGCYTLADEQGRVVVENRFRTNETFSLDFSALPSGSYRMEAAVEFRGREIRTPAQRDRIVVFSPDDRAMPVDSLPFFYYPVETEGAIEFAIGTSEEDLYLELEFFDNDSVLYREPVHLRNELRRFSFPYKDSYRSAVRLSMFGVRNGRVIDETGLFTRPGDVRLDVAVETFRDKTVPGSEEVMTVRVPAGSELAVSIYDATADRYGGNDFSFRPLPEYVNFFPPRIRTSLEAMTRDLMAYAGGVQMQKLAMARSVDNAAGIVTEEAGVSYYADDQEAAEDQPAFEGRTDFRELLAFFPQIQADPSGRTEIRYRTGDLLGTFCVRVMAHDRQLHTGDASESFIVQKELMVIPNLPLFATEGDRIVLKSKIVNLGARELKGVAYIELSDEDGRPLRLKGLDKRPKTLPAGAQDELSWTVEIPGGTGKLTAKIWFATPTASDGEQHEIRVVPAAVTLTEAASFVLDGKNSRKYYEKQFRKQFGAAHPQIEYAEYSTLDAVMEALPEAVKPESDNAIEWVNQLYINQMRNYVRQDDPDSCQAFRRQAFSRLKSFQTGSGGFSWFQGMPANPLLTLYALEKIGQLRSIGAFKPSADEQVVLSRALRYVDEQIAETGSRPSFHPFSLVRDFSVRSLWFDVPMTEEAAAVYKRFIDGTADGWQKISILGKAQLCNLLLRADRTPYEGKDFGKRVRLLCESLKDYAVENATVGCYFPNAVMPFRGLMNSEIYAHAQLIGIFSRLGEQKMVDGIAQWLLLQKHNQAWESTVATTDAVYALVASKARDLRLGAVYCTYTTQLSQVQASAHELSVRRRFVWAGTNVPVEDGELLRIGDKITVIYEIDNTENRSFVQMRAMRPACFYPADERSGYTRYGCYREVKPAETCFYWELLPEEKSTVSETFYVQQEGTFDSGLTEIECLYAREYRGHTGTVRIGVEQR